MLLVIAVIGAVVMARRIKRADLVDDPLVAAHDAELAAAAPDDADPDAERSDVEASA